MYKVLPLFDNSNVTNELSDSELLVYMYIKNNINLIYTQSSDSLSESTFTSPATINRTCKKLGFDGFSHLKYALIDDLDVLKKVNSSEKTVLNTTRLLEKVNFEESIELSNLIRQKKLVFIYSVGASKIAALYLQRQLLNIGIMCIDIEQQKMLENFSNELIIFISSSGETPRIIDLAKNINGRHNLLAITAKNSKLDKMSSCSFTHNILIDKLDPLTREQQIHMLVMINDLVSKI